MKTHAFYTYSHFYIDSLSPNVFIWNKQLLYITIDYFNNTAVIKNKDTTIFFFFFENELYIYLQSGK